MTEHPEYPEDQLREQMRAAFPPRPAGEAEVSAAIAAARAAAPFQSDAEALPPAAGARRSRRLSGPLAVAAAVAAVAVLSVGTTVILSGRDDNTAPAVVAPDTTAAGPAQPTEGGAGTAPALTPSESSSAPASSPPPPTMATTAAPTQPETVTPADLAGTWTLSSADLGDGGAPVAIDRIGLSKVQVTLTFADDEMTFQWGPNSWEGYTYSITGGNSLGFHTLRDSMEGMYSVAGDDDATVAALTILAAVRHAASPMPVAVSGDELTLGFDSDYLRESDPQTTAANGLVTGTGKDRRYTIVLTRGGNTHGSGITANPGR